MVRAGKTLHKPQQNALSVILHLVLCPLTWQLIALTLDREAHPPIRRYIFWFSQPETKTLTCGTHTPGVSWVQASFRRVVQWLLGSATAALRAAPQKGATENKSAHDPYATEELRCGCCHFTQPFTPVCYPFDFSLSLVPLNPWTLFRLICSKFKLTFTQPPFPPSI